MRSEISVAILGCSLGLRVLERILTSAGKLALDDVRVRSKSLTPHASTS